MAFNTNLLKYLKNNNLSSKINFAPQGIIFISDSKAFIGMDHGRIPLISEDLVNKLLPIIDKGMYYEGPAGGPDQKIIEPIFGKYKDSFDSMSVKAMTSHPPEFLYALFSNNPPESISDYITSPNKTIFEAMVKAGYKISSMKKIPPTKRTVEKFLISISNPSKKINFLDIAKKTMATSDNAVKFIKLGASEMWPDGWKNYPNPAGKVAKKANDYRDIWVSTKSPNGAYTIGSGHLFQIAKLTKRSIIDGHKIAK